MPPVPAVETRIRKAGFFLMAFAFLLSLAAIGYWMLFSGFAVYDDEGYILISARDYFVHGKLYETVYSQYGPAFYVLLDIFQRILGSPIDHTWARLLTLTFWVGAAGCCALLVWRQTASRSLSLFTLAATFLFLYFITDEPFHPGSLIFFALAASLYVTTGLISAQKLGAAAAIAGGTGAFLLLTKINVGVFYLAGVGGWAVVNAHSDRLRRLSGPGVVAVFILLAVALMHTLVREAWIQIYLALFASGSVALVIAMKGDALIAPRHTSWFMAAGVSVGLAIPALIWLRGTSLSGLFNGVVLGPLHHPGNYSYPVDWRPGSLPLAGLSLVLAVAHPWICRRFSDEVADRIIVTLRLGAGAALLTGFVLLVNFRAVGAIFSYVAPLIWIWVIPLKGVKTTPSDRAVRGLLATVLLLQFLHAYPVGGSQESWATFLFMPLAALGLGDVRAWFARRRTSAAPSWWSRLSALIIVILMAKIGCTGFVAQRNYASRSPLGLPGAAELHLPESQRTAYRILALNAVAHTDMLFSLPGMFSFNLWTGLPTPTEKNTTLWFALLNAADQRAIIHALERAPRAGFIMQESLMELMRTNKIPLQGELWKYLHQTFSMAFRTEGFSFWVRTGRSIAPLNLATLSRQTSLKANDQHHGGQIDFCFAHDGPPIVAIEVRAMAEVPSSPHLLNATNATVVITAIDSSGRVIAAPTDAAWPLHCPGFNRLSVRFDDLRLIPPLATTVLILKGPKNETLGEVRLGE